MEQNPLVQIDNRFSMIPYWVFESGISSTAIHLYIVLVKYANNATGEAWPSRSTLAKGIGKTDKTVDRALKELVDIGAVKVKARRNPGTKENLPNLYEVITAKREVRKAPDTA